MKDPQIVTPGERHPSPAGLSPTTARAPATITDRNWKPATWVLLVALCGAFFLDALDLTMVGVALPGIGTALDLSASSLQWIVSGYVLGYGGLLLLGGRASDLLGRRQVFLLALSAFGAASVVSTFLSDDTALIALRFVKGASAAFTVPAGLSIITTTFTEGRARSRALGIYSACGASGFSLGLVFGGLLTEIDWRLTFLAPGPVALALLIAGLRVIPRAPRAKVALASLDLPGAVSCTASLLILVYAVVEAPSHGWGDRLTIGLLALSVVLMAVFVLWERRHPTPLLRLGILRSSSLVHANMSAAAMFGGYTSFQFLVTLYVQNSLGWSPIELALALLPGGMVTILFGAKIGALLQRIRTTGLLFVGLAAYLVGYGLFLRVEPSMSYADFLFPTILLLGSGAPRPWVPLAGRPVSPGRSAAERAASTGDFTGGRGPPGAASAGDVPPDIGPESAEERTGGQLRRRRALLSTADPARASAREPGPASADAAEGGRGSPRTPGSPSPVSRAHRSRATRRPSSLARFVPEPSTAPAGLTRRQPEDDPPRATQRPSADVWHCQGPALRARCPRQIPCTAFLTWMPSP